MSRATSEFARYYLDSLVSERVIRSIEGLPSMTAIKVGDTVKATVTGTVKELHDHAACVHIEDANGNNHWVFNSSYSDRGAQFEVTKPAEPEFPNGLYQDTDGELFIRRDGSWTRPGDDGDDACPPRHWVARFKRVSTPFPGQNPY